MRRRFDIIAGLVLVAALASLLPWTHVQASLRPAPDFELELFDDGTIFHLADHKGK